MPTFSNPASDADELREAVRGLAHATRSIEDPTSIYPMLGSISSALASLSQSLHQLGQFHDGPSRKQVWMNGDVHAGHAASYRESWGASSRRRDDPSSRGMRGPGARDRGDDRLRHLRLPVICIGPALIASARDVAVTGWQDGRLHSAVLVSPGRERRHDRKLRKAAARELLSADREARRTDARRKAEQLGAEKRATVTLPRAGESGPTALRTIPSPTPSGHLSDPGGRVPVPRRRRSGQ